MNYAERINYHYSLFQGEARAVFSSAAYAFFEANPEIESFGWAQYTPYFNDGEACEFEIERFLINNQSLDVFLSTHWPADYRSADRIQTEIDRNKVNPEVVRLLEQEKNLATNRYLEFERQTSQVKEFLDSFSEQHLQMIFGSHVRVVVHRNNTITVESYEDHE